MMQKFLMIAGSVAAGTGAVRAMGDTGWFLTVDGHTRARALRGRQIQFSHAEAFPRALAVQWFGVGLIWWHGRLPG